MYRHVCFYVPQHVLTNIAKYRALQGEDVSGVRKSIQVSEALRQNRRQSAEASLISTNPGPHGLASRKTKEGGAGAVAGVTMPAPSTHARLIYDDQNQWNFDVVDVRNEGDPAVAQQNADLAYDALGATLEFYRVVLGRNSIDNLGLNLDANVNYGVSFDNAFWDGTRMVFGNGDNTIFVDFTGDVSVPGHELSHGVTQYTAALEYHDQPGALNEATSDIFGACIDARVHGQDAGTFDWLIGEDIMAPGLYGEALRSMAYPGTAYDNPILGTDPQPATMAGYVPGGDVHVNSGIINRWFYLMATDLGMDAAAKIWYATLQNLSPASQFADAAAVAAAQARILARAGTVPRRAPQTVRGTAKAQGII
jgi:Zn-dependent metalloprotease